jgi:hypothetical protein
MSTHHIGAKLHIYPGEFKLLLKLLNAGKIHLAHDLSQDDSLLIENLLDEIKDLALEHSL